MKILVCPLIFGNRPKDTITSNLKRAGHRHDVHYICAEGISKALNLGLAEIEDYDAIAFLANDIIEPDNWLKYKVEALQRYFEAGIVATRLDSLQPTVVCEKIIGNWLISAKVVEAIGKFNENYHPYGPIDLEYCERAWLANFRTYYVMGCMAQHMGSHATGNEYGWDKSELVANYWPQYVQDIQDYKQKLKPIKII